MDERKFGVIIHVTDENYCSRLVESLSATIIPKDFSAEVQLVKGNEKYFAYEEARKECDAKYKIYIDERAVIKDKKFLSKLLKIFKNKQIGAVGTSGALQLSTHGVSLTSKKRAPQNYSGEAEMLDGFFFATQYDLSWREDLFTDNFFGGQAQCVEFKRMGYKIFIGGDWITYPDKNITIDADSQRIFLDEYSKDLFPLITVPMPTFNRPKYFREALDSVLNQTYRNFEVIISDDSTNDETEQLMANYTDPRIKYFRHRGFTSHDNWNFLRDYNNPAAEYVHWLLDDDRWLPRKLEVMTEVFRNNPDVSLVTSTRRHIDSDGKFIGDNSQRLNLKQDTKIDGNTAGKLLFHIDDYIGMPSNVGIRKNCLRNGDLCWNEDERGFFSLIDVSTFCQLLSKGNLYWVLEYLSDARIHNAAAEHLDYGVFLISINYAKLLKLAWERKIFLRNEKDLQMAMTYWLSLAANRLRFGYAKNVRTKEFITLEKTFVAMSQALINGYKFELPTIEYSAQDKFTKMN